MRRKCHRIIAVVAAVRLKCLSSSHYMRNTLEFRLSSLWRFRSIINTTMRPIPPFPGPSLPPSLPSRFSASTPLSIYGDGKCWRLGLIRFNHTTHSWAAASCLNYLLMTVWLADYMCTLCMAHSFLFLLDWFLILCLYDLISCGCRCLFRPRCIFFYIVFIFLK